MAPDKETDGWDAERDRNCRVTLMKNVRFSLIPLFSGSDFRVSEGEKKVKK